MSQYYQTWFKLVIWGIIAFGAILALHAFPATEGPSALFLTCFLSGPFRLIRATISALRWA